MNIEIKYKKYDNKKYYTYTNIYTKIRLIIISKNHVSLITGVNINNLRYLDFKRKNIIYLKYKTFNNTIRSLINE